MKYDKPYILEVQSMENLFLRTQASGNNGIAPSEPDLVCGVFDCDSQGNDVALSVEWQDDAGSDVNGYTVRMDINGDIFDIKDENAAGGSATCNITESPAGIYTLTCSEFQLDEEGCDNCDNYSLISITDEFGNTFIVDGETSCTTDEC